VFVVVVVVVVVEKMLSLYSDGKGDSGDDVRMNLMILGHLYCCCCGGYRLSLRMN
jgi:hypothetical protein